MKIVVFGNEARVGALRDDGVVDLHATDPQIPATLPEFIAGGPAVLEAAGRAIERGVVRPLHEVALRAPWPRKRIACAGGNYAAHSYGMAINRGAQGITLETQAKRIRDAGLWGFWKHLDEIAGPGDAIPFPKHAEYLDYEGEVAVVVAKRGKEIKADRAADYIWGVTLGVDWSIRDRDGGPQRPLSFNLQKNFDFSASLGPCIVVGELDPQNIDVETRVAGELRQSYNTREMVFSFGELLEFLSRDLTLVPGDIVFGGTGAGTAQDSTKPNSDGSLPLDRFLRRGQVVEVSSPLIGILANTIS